MDTSAVQTVETGLDTMGVKQDSGLLTRPELEQMITWETNNLYEYLKELYDHQHEDMVDDRSVLILEYSASSQSWCMPPLKQFAA